MKVNWSFSGIFQRRSDLACTSAPTAPAELADLLHQTQAVASQHYGRSPHHLRQSYGWQGLTEPALIDLLKQAHAVPAEADLYQVPGLRWLKPVSTQPMLQPGQTYSYQFTSSVLLDYILQLSPDDPQLPRPITAEPITGIYTVQLTNSEIDAIALPDQLRETLWSEAKTSWQNLSSQERIRCAMQSYSQQISMPLPAPESSQLTVTVELSELSSDEQTAIRVLRQPHWPEMTAAVQELVEAYEATYRYVLTENSQQTANPRLNQLKIAVEQEQAVQWVIGRGNRCNRSAIESIITEAKQFLCVSSFIIEDQQIAELICQKAATLPQGVWILTDLNAKRLGKLDQQIEISQPDLYQHANWLKRECLRQLVDAKVQIQSGRFHLKTIISEQAAYLGSCNLTGGSLSLNLEAGMLVQQNPLHASLLQRFQTIWQQSSTEVILPARSQEGILVRSVQPSLNPPDFAINTDSSGIFLTPSTYYRDLHRELSDFRGQVWIYSRSFNPGVKLQGLLNSPLRPIRLYLNAENQPRFLSSMIQRFPIRNLHAKVTILGDRVAYIGGINFSFEPSALALTDLMYKTTQIQEIQQLRQQLSRFSP